MAFREKIVPNFGGRPREFEPVEHERRDPSIQLDAKQRLAALKHAREHRISLAEAVRQLFDED
jgi:hypothetical protein